MQHPTCTNTRIRSTHDAHKIFFAVQHGILPLVTRRLDADERLALQSGCVYAWEERGAHSEITGLGIERFTEGRRWSPSRVRDEFLFYYEKYTPPHDASQPNNMDRPTPRDWDPLVKQTYSVWVDTPHGRRKWHLTAYFTQATVDQLGTINEIPGVGTLFVPEGLFQSTRTGKNRKPDDSESRTGRRDVLATSANNSNANRKYAPFPHANGYAPPVNDPLPSADHQTHLDGIQNAPYYHPGTSAPLPHLPAAPSPYGSNLPPLQNTAAGHESDRRVQHSVHGDVTGAPMGRYPGHAVSSLSASGYPEPELSYPSPQPQHHHAHLRERFISNSRDAEYHEATAATSIWGPSLASPAVSNAQSYPLRTPHATAPLPNYAVTYYASEHSVDPYARFPSPNSNQTSPSTSHSNHSSSPSISSHEYGLSEDRHAPYETTSSIRSTRFDTELDSMADGPSRVKLAPLHSLRNHPYRRDPVDDKALRKLRPRAP